MAPRSISGVDSVLVAGGFERSSFERARCHVFDDDADEQRCVEPSARELGIDESWVASAKAQLEVLAACQRVLKGGTFSHWEHVDSCTDAGSIEQAGVVKPKSVGDVDHRRRTRTRCREAMREARFWPSMRLDMSGHRLETFAQGS
jgi:hypothetical protein